MKNTLLILFAPFNPVLLDGRIWSDAWSTDIQITSYHSHHQKRRHEQWCNSIIPKKLTARPTLLKNTRISSTKTPESASENERCDEFKDEDQSSHETKSLKDFLMPIPQCIPSQMSPTSLAYIGDSVFELFIRTRYVWPTRRTTDLQKLVVAKVRGEHRFSSHG